VKRPENRSEAETQTLQRLNAVHWVVERCCSLLEGFAEMLRDKKGSGEEREEARRRLEEWLQKAKASGVVELKDFAVKLSQDAQAVLAAMVLPYSQGQTEGRINKLKLVKRSMYGRGKFDLLRQRVLYTAS
jgi:transposase